MRMRCGLLLGLVLATGCRQILGIEDPTVYDEKVTGHVQLRDSYNLATGLPTLRARPYTAAELAIEVRLDDGSSPPVTVNDDGTFVFARATAEQPYRLTVATPRTQVTYQHDAAHLELADRLPGRADAVPVTKSTKVSFDLGTATGNALVLSSGVWSHTLTQIRDTAVFELDWTTTVPFPPTGLLRADLGDRLYLGFLEVVGALQPYVALTRFQSFAITLVDGQPVTITEPPLLDLVRDRCARIQASRATAMQRLRTAMPAFPGGEAFYQLGSTTIGDTGTPFQRLLVYDISANSDSNLDVAYANPFGGTEVVASIGARISRIATGSLPVRLTVGGMVSQLMTPSPPSPPSPPSAPACRVTVLDSTIEVPGVPAIAGVPVEKDDLDVKLAAGVDPEVTWAGGTAGAANISYVTLYELVTSSGVGSEPVLVARQTVATLKETATLDRDRFVAGTAYVIAVDTVIGVPGAATGDLDTQAYPTGVMRSLSSTFRAR